MSRIIRKNDNKLALGRLGKIKIGVKGVTQSGKEYPKAIDYFRFDSPDKELEARMNSLHDKKSELTVIFYSSDPEVSCNEFYELRSGVNGKLVATGNGQQFTFTDDEDNKKTLSVSDFESNEKFRAFFDSLAKKHKGQFKPTLIMRVVVMGSPDLGYWEIRTQGEKSSIANLVGVYDTALATFGQVDRIPFKLKVSMHTSDGIGQTRKYPTLSLFPTIGYEEAPLIGSMGSEIKGLITKGTLEKANSETPAIGSGSTTSHVHDKTSIAQPSVSTIEDAEFAEVSREDELREISEYLGWMTDVAAVEKYFLQNESWASEEEIVALFENRKNELEKED